MNKGDLIGLTDDIQVGLREISRESDDMSVCLDADALCRIVLSLRHKIQESKNIQE